jgi:hypothetical protein
MYEMRYTPQLYTIDVRSGRDHKYNTATTDRHHSRTP